MNVLAFDTTLNSCSVSVARADRIVAASAELRARGHAERIVPMIQEVSRKAGLAVAGYDLIAITVGPGTFTGVRIGLAAARALALPGRTPILGFGTLEAIALSSPGDGPLMIAVDARRGEVYCQFFSAAGDPLSAPSAATPGTAAHEARRHLPDGGRIAGSGWALMAPELPDWPTVENTEDTAITGAMALSASSRASQARAGRPPSPLYLRAPDARLPQSS